MSFTYDPVNLATSELFQVRLEIGNVAEHDIVSMQDEEINYIISKVSTNVDLTPEQIVQQSASLCFDTLITRAGYLLDSESGQVSESA